MQLAAEEYDRNRYKGILKLMPQFGGMRRYAWKEAHIAKKLVDMGVDEFDPDPKGKKPKCRPKSAARRQTQTTTPNLYDPSLLQQASTSYAPPQEMECLQPPRMSPEELEAMFQSFHCDDSDDSPEPESVEDSVGGTTGLPPFYTAGRRESVAHSDSGIENDDSYGTPMAQQHCPQFLPQDTPQAPYAQQRPAPGQGHH